jgi:hypothetical protein
MTPRTASKQTKARSIDSRLAELEHKREQLAAAAREIKVKLAEYDTDRRLRGEMSTDNPHQQDYDKAVALLAPVEEELTAFKRETLGARVDAAINPDEAAEQIRAEEVSRRLASSWRHSGLHLSRA